MTPPSNDQHSADEGDLEDRALVARIARGDRSALEQLYRRHADWLTLRLESRCGDPDLADIAVQDTFIAVWQSARKFKGTGAVGAWLWGIGVRRLIDQLRKRRPIPIAPDAMLDHLRSGETSSADAFESQLVESGDLGDIVPALRQLDPSLQAVLVATAIDGLSTKEAARLLGVPQGTVKTRLMRARAQLQEALG